MEIDGRTYKMFEISDHYRPLLWVVRVDQQEKIEEDVG